MTYKMGKLIRLFLVEGNPNGLRTIEISNMTIYSTIFPRAKLKTFSERSESNKAGCYILLGNDINNPDDMRVYIGEGENVLSRLKTHASGSNSKDFWEEAIVFTSKDDYITKTQIQYLESELCRLVDEAGNVIMDNGNKPAKPNLSEVDSSEMLQFLDAIKLILSSIGVDILESKKVTKEIRDEIRDEIIYKFEFKNVVGRMKIEEDKYIVLKGSTANFKNRPSANVSIVRMRQRLVDEGILKFINDKNYYIFTEDYIFNSPTYAAVSITGGNENGRKCWKYKGKTIEQVEKEEFNLNEQLL